MARADRVKARQAKRRQKARDKKAKQRTRQKARSTRQRTRQTNRSGRQEKRQDKKIARSDNRTRRQSARQESRSQRQQTRQDNRTRRTEGRQSVRKEKIMQKGQSGYWSPEGIEARGNRATNIIGASGELVGDLAPIVAGAMTGGASTLLGSLTGLAGETDLQGFGGDVNQPQEFEIDTMSDDSFDFSFSNPIVIGGAIGLAGLAYFVMRPKKKGAK